MSRTRRVFVETSDPGVLGEALRSQFFVKGWSLADGVDRLTCLDNKWRCLVTEHDGEEVRLQYSVFDPLTMYFVFEDDDVLTLVDGVWDWCSIHDFQEDELLCLNDDVEDLPEEDETWDEEDDGLYYSMDEGYDDEDEDY